MVKEDVYCGIDPGCKGAVCALLAKQNKVIFKSTTGDPLELLEWYGQLNQAYNLRLIMIEDVHAIPGAAAGSSFSFGWNVGEMNLIARMSR